MNAKDIKALLIALNSSDNSFSKYPFGNKELTEKIKRLETENRIKFNSLTARWEKA